MKLLSYEDVFKGIRDLGYDDYDKFKNRRDFLFLQPFGYFLRQNAKLWRKINLTEMVATYVEKCGIPPTEVIPDKSVRYWFYDDVYDYGSKVRVAHYKGKDFSMTEYEQYLSVIRTECYKEKDVSHQRLVIDTKTKTVVTGILMLSRI